jgi:hypothetical protein
LHAAPLLGITGRVAVGFVSLCVPGVWQASRVSCAGFPGWACGDTSALPVVVGLVTPGSELLPFGEGSLAIVGDAAVAAPPGDVWAKLWDVIVRESTASAIGIYRVIVASSGYWRQ